jgi:tRNA pseudouridine55 synthase
MTASGLLNLHKPAGITLRKALDVVKRLVRPAKTGHAGTLDPLATGVLIAAVGSATRLIEYVQRMPKTYRATFLLGRSSPTEDIEGDVAELPGAPQPTHSQVCAAATRLVGRVEQRPPAFSALKVEGRRAYDLARQGKSVPLESRTIDVYRIDVLSYHYPELMLDIECGSGTYIRSLGRDLAESLGTAAVMSALTRTRIGGFSVEDAVLPEQLTPDNWAAFLQPSLLAVGYLPRVPLTAAEVARIRNGLAIEFDRPPISPGEGVPKAESHPGSDASAQEYAGIDASGALVGILVSREPGQLRPLRNLT